MCDKAEFELCRLCLNSRGLLMNVFGDNSKLQFLLKNTIEDLIDVKVLEDANYPWFVCSNCMEKLTEFRLFKHRCAECLSVFHNRIQKGCNPATEDWMTNPDEFLGEMKVEIDDNPITSVAADSSVVDVSDDMIIIKEEKDTTIERFVDPEIDTDSSMVTSMREGDSHCSGNYEAGKLDCSGDKDLHYSSDEEVDCKEECDANVPKEEDGLGGEVLQAQDNEQKQNGAGKDAAGSLLHACHICYKVFAQLDLLKFHIKHVHIEKGMQFSCDVCFESFECKNDLARHIKSVHTLKKDHQCQQCSRNLKILSQQKTHVSIHTDEMPFKCAVCSKGFTQKRYLKRHKLTHSGEKDFKCEVCSKQFSLKSNLTQHMVTHTGEKRHQCPICSKTFSLKGNLRKHVLTHTDDKPHKCHRCSKAFSIKCNLMQHLLTHSDERGHKCGVCVKTFSLKGNLTRHMLTHTGGKPHKCFKCSKAFSMKCNLMQHMVTHIV